MSDLSKLPPRAYTVSALWWALSPEQQRIVAELRPNDRWTVEGYDLVVQRVAMPLQVFDRDGTAGEPIWIERRQVDISRGWKEFEP